MQSANVSWRAKPVNFGLERPYSRCLGKPPYRREAAQVAMQINKAPAGHELFGA